MTTGNSTPFIEALTVDRGQEFQDFKPAWFEYAHITSPDDTKPLRDYLSTLVAPILALEGVHISSVRFLISDDDDPNACVIKDDPNDAVVYVTKGLINYVDSEDELVGILAHELGHIEIAARIGAHDNSRPEEIGADGFAAQWMVRIGRNWRAFQRFFKKMAAEEETFSKQEFSPHKFKQQIADVHSTSLDRVQHTQTAVGILAIQEKRDIPEPEEKLVPKEIREALSTLARHRSYIDLVLDQQNFSTQPARAQLEMLVNLDPGHYQDKVFPPEAQKSGQPYADAMTQHRACEERLKRYQHLVLEALQKFESEKEDGAAWSTADVALLNKAVDAAGLYTNLNVKSGDPYIHLNPTIYRQVNKMLHGPDGRIMPLGSKLEQFVNSLSAFVSAKSYDDALIAAQKLKEEIKSHTALNFSGRAFEHSEEWKRDLLLYKSMVLPGFRSRGGSKTLPWAQHVGWAAEDKTGVIAEMLWRAGVNKDRKLWKAMPVDQMEERATEWNFTQPAGQLARYSMTDPKLLDAIKRNRQWDYIKPKRISKSQTQLVMDVPFNRAEMKKFEAFAEKKLAETFNHLALAVPAFEPGTLAKALPEFVMKNEKVLTAPLIYRDESKCFSRPDYDQDFSLHRQRSQALVDAIDNCLQAGDEGDREAVRQFFLNKASYGNTAAPCLDWLARGWEGVYPWDSPLIRFVAEDRHGIFTPVDRAGLLLKECRYSAGNGNDVRGNDDKKQDIPFWRNVFGYRAPESFADLVAVAQLMNVGDRKDKRTLAESEDETYSWQGGASNLWFEKDRLLTAEIERFFDRKPEIPSADFAVFATFYLDHMKSSILSGLLSVSEARGVSNAIKGDAPNLKSVSFNRDMKGLTLEDKVDTYQFLDHDGLMPNLGYKFSFGKMIFEDINALDDNDRKMTLLERLVFTAQRGLDRPVSDFVLSEKALDAWAKLAARKLGTDNGSEVYYAAAIPMLEKIEKGVSERDRFHAFRSFADALIAQRPVCHDIEKRIALKSENLDIKADIAMRGTETYLQWLRSSRQNREDMLDFLMQTENEDTTSRLSDKFITWLGEEPIYRKAMFVSEIGIMPLGEMGATDEEVIRKMQDPELDRKIKEKTNEIGQSMHRLFWSRSLELRTVFMNYILVTADELNKDPEAAWRNGLQMTLDRLFATEPADPNEKIRNQWAREFIEIYLESAHESERSLIMAALISSAQTDAVGYTQSFGERLANILSMLGPAYYKLGQAIHSHPHTPEDIRQPMAKLKSLGEKPPRWDYLRRVDEAVPETMRSRIAWTGDIVGRASFFTTSPVRMTGGEEYMLGVLGKNAAGEAEHGFRRLESCARKLATRNKEFGGISRNAIAMIRQAYDLVKVETNMKLGARQSVFMQKQYGGLVAEADGYKFRYDPKAWRFYGDNFKLMDIAQGCHFDEMPETSTTDIARKKAFAKADSAVELMFPLSRQRSDNDRHERQMKIQGEVVGLFDPGGMLLEEPTAEDMRALADALKVILPAATGKAGAGDAATILSDYLVSLEEKTGNSPDYLMHVQKSLLARGGFLRYLDAKDFSDIVSGLVRGNHIDPVIRNALVFDKANLNLSAGLSMLRGAFQTPSVKIMREEPPQMQEPDYIPDTPRKLAKIPSSPIQASMPLPPQTHAISFQLAA